MPSPNGRHQSAPPVFSPTGQPSKDRPEAAAQGGDFLTTAQGVRLPDTDHSLKVGERGPKGRALAQDDQPGQPGLEGLEAEPLEQLLITVQRRAPLVIVIAHVIGRRFGPGTALPSPAGGHR